MFSTTDLWQLQTGAEWLAVINNFRDNGEAMPTIQTNNALQVINYILKNTQFWLMTENLELVTFPWHLSVLSQSNQ